MCLVNGKLMNERVNVISLICFYLIYYSFQNDLLNQSIDIFMAYFCIKTVSYIRYYLL